MGHITRVQLRAYRPRGRPFGNGEAPSALRAFPTPARLLAEIGAVLLIAAGIGLAADFAVNAMTR